ncbi:hypothetical protein [Cystobacter ferrugineus]|nr:hypothetical protein [Cystobacter ferrugineus]
MLFYQHSGERGKSAPTKGLKEGSDAGLDAIQDEGLAACLVVDPAALTH